MISILDGTKTVTAAATAERLVATTVPEFSRKVATVVIQALGGDNANAGKNTGKVALGASDVSFSKGVQLAIPTNGTTAPSLAIESSKGVNEIDLSEIYVKAGVDGEGVSWIGIRV